jgi:UDP-glucuronate 4-epimerase
MAYYKFTKAIINGDPIDVYNNGDMKRDFTYIDDIIAGVVRVIDRIPSAQANAVSAAQAPYKLYNIGNNNPVTLGSFIEAIEESCDQKAVTNYLPMQPGDVPVTFADIDELIDEVSFKPETSIGDGLGKFVDWYLDFYSERKSNV